MTHLRIEQNNILENVSSAVIEKLYLLAISGDLDLSSNLAGNLYTTATYLEYIDALCKTLLNPNGMFPDLTISATTTYMMFLDPEVQNKLKNWVGDGVGVISSLFLAATTLPASYNGSSLFFLNTAITKFNELSRAINLTTLADSAFKGASNLELIDISNITSVGQSTFSACKKCLFTGQGLSNLQHMKKESFQMCWNLSGAVNISNLLDTDIKDFCFLECKTMTSITIPTTVTSLGINVFLNCTALTTCTGFSNITSINGNCFRSCSSLTSIDIDLSKLTSIGENVFRGCSSLGSGQTLELNLTNQTNYPNNALLGTAFTRLILHSPLLSSNYDTRYPIYEEMRQLTYLDLSDWRPGKNAVNTSLYKDCQFYNNTSLVTYIAPITTNYIGTAINDMGKYANARYFILLNTTPPSINTTDSNNSPSTWFYNKQGNVHIYVPDSAVSAYLNDSAWSTIGGYNGSDTISDRLHGLSELPAGVWTTGLASQYLTAALLATS